MRERRAESKGVSRERKRETEEMTERGGRYIWWRPWRALGYSPLPGTKHGHYMLLRLLLGRSAIVRLSCAQEPVEV
jgi:hypothetical protein